jgi:uncharacterized cupredoxin-like copper-binding protein
VKPVHLLVSTGLAVTTAALAPIAIGSSDPGARVTKTSVSVTAKEFKFALRPTRATHGSVTFRIRNAGTLAHDFKIAGRKTAKIPRGKSATLTVSLRRGTYRYICTIPGHAASGMKGTFRVR